MVAQVSPARVRRRLIKVANELSVEYVMEVLDFALFMRAQQRRHNTRQIQMNNGAPYLAARAANQDGCTKTIAALQADGMGGRLLEQLLAARAEDKAREH